MSIQDYINQIPAALSEGERLVACNLLHEIKAYGECAGGERASWEYEDILAEQNAKAVLFLCNAIAEARIPPSFSEKKPRDIIPFHEFYKAKE